MPLSHPLPPLVRCLQGERIDPPPLWLMRQAGRYLPEYRAVRAKAGGFLDLCYDPDLATQVTLQPIRRYQLDAAILFADILLIPHALGQDLRFTAGEGPVLSPVVTGKTLARLSLQKMDARLAPVMETVRRLRAALAPSVGLIGFAGAPWTVATYMVEGGGSKDHAATRAFAYEAPAAFDSLLALLVDATARYLAQQIEAGAQCVQIFDSWAGSAPAAGFAPWVIAPTREIVTRLKSRYPDVPVIGFARGVGEKLGAYARETGVDAVGIDYGLDLAWADGVLAPGLCIQGNLDPALLLAGGKVLAAAVRETLAAAGERPHVFNLGHGILPQTPPEHVAALVEMVKNGRLA
ncbi:MAG: uroporphyrinogen decarboxylase [Pseudomonadota bacterium]